MNSSHLKLLLGFLVISCEVEIHLLFDISFRDSSLYKLTVSLSNKLALNWSEYVIT
jgi:hypothetical protein